MRALLVGPEGHGGEGVYVDGLAADPPDGVRYATSRGFGTSGEGARSRRIAEVALNRVVHPRAIPDMGFRALELHERFDLVHVHAHPVSLRGLRGAPVVMSEGSSAAVYLAHYLGWDDDRLAAGLRRSRRLYRALGIRDRLLAMERVQLVYVFSEWARAVNIRWGADPAKLRVLAPGFATPPAVERPERETTTFAFVGGDFERKGGFTLLEAFAAACAEDAGVRLLLVGSDPAARHPDRAHHGWVSERARARGLETLARLEADGRVHRVPWTDAERVQRELLPGADAFVLPTRAEGYGFATVEAMGHGLPVVAARTGPAAELVEDGVTGLLVDAGDVAALRDALLALAASPQRRRALGEAGRERFLARHTTARARAGLGALYAEALAA